jgi:hypothetical protein
MKEFKELTIGSTLLRIYEDGMIERYRNKWSIIENTPNHKKGYNVVMIEKKQYMRSRLVCHAFNNLDLSSKYVIHYLDDNKLNCSIDNLSIETAVSLKKYYN